MRRIEPKKGVSQRLIVNGLSERNYIIMFTVYIAAVFVAATLVRLLTDGNISFNLFFFFALLLVASIFGFRLFLARQTEKERSKDYPRGDVNIINKDFQ